MRQCIKQNYCKCVQLFGGTRKNIKNEHTNRNGTLVTLISKENFNLSNYDANDSLYHKNVLGTTRKQFKRKYLQGLLAKYALQFKSRF